MVKILDATEYAGSVDGVSAGGLVRRGMHTSNEDDKGESEKVEWECGEQ
jgi:hypothetical protein